MLHLLTITSKINLTWQISSVNSLIASGISHLFSFILPTQRRMNQPMAGFCFRLDAVVNCVTCYNKFGVATGNVGIELAT